MVKESDYSDGDPDDVVMSDRPFDQNKSKDNNSLSVGDSVQLSPCVCTDLSSDQGTDRSCNFDFDRCRFGVFHVLNNDYVSWEKYAIGDSASPTILSQGNRFYADKEKEVRFHGALPLFLEPPVI
jgi:hypothetical protein